MSISGPLLFNIFICNFFFDDIKIDVANHADDTTPIVHGVEYDKVTKLLEKILRSFSFGSRIIF